MPLLYIILLLVKFQCANVKSLLLHIKSTRACYPKTHYWRSLELFGYRYFLDYWLFNYLNKFKPDDLSSYKQALAFYAHIPVLLSVATSTKKTHIFNGLMSIPIQHVYIINGSDNRHFGIYIIFGIHQNYIVIKT